MCAVNATTRQTDGMAVAQRFVGHRVARVEDPRLLTGKGRYVDDVTVQFTAAGTNYTLNLPGATLNVDPSVNTTTSTYDAVNGIWVTTLPYSLENEDVFRKEPLLYSAVFVRQEKPLPLFLFFADHMGDRRNLISRLQ